MSVKENIYVNCLPLKEKIEHFRNLMIRTGMEEGFSNPKTIELSQNLDNLLIEYFIVKKKS
ncbi:aspartyl-phosphate phosphatase Spo0E family protein [Priestia sp. SB1]|uniref:Aspartyl-phosphate phosphatase Spo0E family protein n=1 Tax=Priestia aryabhattai TaxID=412384 RepID=A0AAX6NF50_PRIAR|nr:aspartyl-phosphate phosphatase Spo0E family protein [Priestia aryabhattai]MDU9694114.1 aspartyl-phosphate phosphatase Spo0E family protein [Priestia aryabhattai]NGY88592.1 aspartyl-phosphate phosphatase Spo0E family protein [Priestia megaterium]